MMKRLFILFSSAVCVFLLPLAGCALPTVQESINQFIGTKFTNPPRPEKRWVQAKDKDGREMTIIQLWEIDTNGQGKMTNLSTTKKS